MSLLSATYKEATYTYQPMMNQIVVVVRAPEWGAIEVRFPTPPASFVMERWENMPEQLQVFFTKVCGYNFATNPQNL